MKRLDVRLPDKHSQILDDYCSRTGAKKTGTIKMLIEALVDDRFLEILLRDR